jgi:hypothetical protein
MMVTHLFMPNKNLPQIFLWPVLIALVSLAGLILALVYDDAREWLANVAIALPVLVALFFYWLQPLFSRR